MGTTRTGGLHRKSDDDPVMAGGRPTENPRGRNTPAPSAAIPHLLLLHHAPTHQITPFGSNGYYSPAHETARQAVNSYIRGNAFDAFIDFDAAVRDTSTPPRLLPVRASCASGAWRVDFRVCPARAAGDVYLAPLASTARLHALFHAHAGVRQWRRSPPQPCGVPKNGGHGEPCAVRGVAVQGGGPARVRGALSRAGGPRGVLWERRR